jgi:hypothetical protein
MKKFQKMFVLLAALALIAAFFVLVASPSRNVSATTEYRQQGDEDCRKCHPQPANLWEGSHHNTGNVTCIVCHKLAVSGGKHPDNAKYTVESEEITCQVCHIDVTGADISGQEALSKHGRVGLTCISCHEQHSQGLKLSAGSRIVCENCHKKEMAVMLSSTHYKAGLSCVNCHMGEGKSHTMAVALETCGKCHDNPHEANLMLSAGLDVKVMGTPAAMAKVTPKPTEEEHAAPVSGGVNMPPWTLVFAGMLIGGVITWALAGRDPGRPSQTLGKHPGKPADEDIQKPPGKDATKEPITAPKKNPAKNPEKQPNDSSNSPDKK